MKDRVKSADFVGLHSPSLEKCRDISYPILYNNTEIHSVSNRWLASQRILNQDSDPEVIKAYKMLRTQVLVKLRENNWNSLAILSARANQGASLTAINLAISVAMDYQHTALLADFNLQDPSIHTYLNYNPAEGLSDHLLHGSPVKDMLFTPGMEGLVILPGREQIFDSSERLTSPALRNLVQDLKQRYSSRVIIFDLPPMLETDDAIAFLDQFDAGLLVIEEGGTTRPDLQRMSELLGDKPIIGSVFNNYKS